MDIKIGTIAILKEDFGKKLTNITENYIIIALTDYSISMKGTTSKSVVSVPLETFLKNIEKFDIPKSMSPIKIYYEQTNNIEQPPVKPPTEVEVKPTPIQYTTIFNPEVSGGITFKLSTINGTVTKNSSFNPYANPYGSIYG